MELLIAIIVIGGMFGGFWEGRRFGRQEVIKAIKGNPTGAACTGNGVGRG